MSYLVRLIHKNCKVYKQQKLRSNLCIMDDPNEENVEPNWVIVNSVDIAEEAISLDSNGPSDENQVEKNHDSTESDVESDGISIISESSHLHEGSNEDENLSSSEHIENNEVGENEASKVSAVENVPETQINWTFVDSENSPSEMSSSNQFYLNCLQEPVQELSEHELGSVQSDLDSDGISIISDCDSLNEFTEDDKKLSEEILLAENGDNKKNELASKLHSGIKKYCNGVLIGTILLATSSIFLGHYFKSDQIEEDLTIYNEEFNSELKEKVPDEINDFQGKYEVPTALVYCQERHKTDDIFLESNVKKCLKKIEKRIKRKKENFVKEEDMRKWEKFLKSKEKYLEEKEKFLIKREYALLKAEAKLKHKIFKKRKWDKQENLNEIYKNTEDLSKVKQSEEIEDLKLKIKNKNYKEIMRKNIKNILKHNYKMHAHKNFHKNKKEFNEYKDKDFKLKYKDTPSNGKPNKDDSNKKILKNKNLDEQTLNENTDALKNTKLNDNLQYSSSKENKYDTVKEKRVKASTNYIVLGNTNDNQTASGYWVGRLYKGRSDLRNRKHSGDWYFDRASYRKTRRDKAKWYFDWMMDRELLRYKRTFYM